MSEIKFNLEKPSSVKIRIRNQYGRVLDILDYNELPEGEQCVSWKPKSAALGNVFKYEIEIEGRETQSGILTARSNPAERSR